MELYGLDCVDLVVSYTIQFLFIAKKCKFSKNHQQIPPLQLLTDMDWQTATLRKNLWEEKGVYLKSKFTLSHADDKTAAALCRLKRSMSLHFLPHSIQLVTSQQVICLWDTHVMNRVGCGQMCSIKDESSNTQREVEQQFSAYCDSAYIYK